MKGESDKSGCTTHRRQEEPEQSVSCLQISSLPRAMSTHQTALRQADMHEKSDKYDSEKPDKLQAMNVYR